MDKRQEQLIEKFPWYGPHLAYLGYAVPFAPQSANLRNAKLRGANMTGADLRYINLTGADLTSANLICATMTNANLTNATMIRANLRGANMPYANLTNANLDFSCLPLWCGALEFRDDSTQILRQIAYSLARIKQYNGVPLLPGEAEFANGWEGITLHNLPLIVEDNNGA